MERTDPLIIDHTCTTLSEIPASWIDKVQDEVKWHYAHTSHGGQLTTGLQRIEDSDTMYSVAIGSSTLPTETGAFCIFNGQENSTYIAPEQYWKTTDGMNQTRDVLNHNHSIHFSQWSWCTQLNSYSENEMKAYLDSMQVLETEFPEETFIYMTGNAQADGSGGYNRYQRNEYIRQFCRDNNKVLYDFADLDAWWYNPSTEQWEQNTYTYDGHIIPIEHSHFNGSESGHTTYESCEQKGKAVWWMMAKLDGWDDGTSLINLNINQPTQFELQQNFPNPFNPTTTICYQLSDVSEVQLSVYSALGEKVRVLVNGRQESGEHVVQFNGGNLASGVYFYTLKIEDLLSTRKMLLMR